MNPIRFLYNVWSGLYFSTLIALFYIPTILLAQSERTMPIAIAGYRIIAKLVLWGIGMPLKVEYRFKPDKKQVYVFVANHFSYLDVIVMSALIENYFAFIGKSGAKKIPFLGYYFRKMHIEVDRSDKNSRTTSLLQGIRTIASGRSIMLMPEGGIISKNFPKMHQPFKDGAFLMAVENQVPIVPITLLNLWKIMPEHTLHWGIPHVIVHEPISTVGKTKDDIEALKQELYDIIQPALDEYKEKHKR